MKLLIMPRHLSKTERKLREAGHDIRASRADATLMTPAQRAALATAEDVQIDCMTDAHLPDMPLAKRVRLNNMPNLAVLPQIPACRDLLLNTMTGLKELPDLSCVDRIRLRHLPLITAIGPLKEGVELSVHDVPLPADLCVALPIQNVDGEIVDHIEMAVKTQVVAMPVRRAKHREDPK